MRTRIYLTVVWLVGLFASIATVWSYSLTSDATGKPRLLAQDVLPCVRPVIILYSFYVGGMLAFWFLKPFQPAKNDQADRVRFWLSIVCAVALNVVVLLSLGQQHFWSTEVRVVSDDVRSAVTWAKWLSFLVAPANAYYFGMRKQPSS